MSFTARILHVMELLNFMTCSFFIFVFQKPVCILVGIRKSDKEK